jgi:integrase
MEDELERIMEACKECLTYVNQLCIPLVIRIAIDTGMRLQEILNILWKDLDLFNRTINISKSKTDDKQEVEGRIIVMPPLTLYMLTALLKQADSARKMTYTTEGHALMATIPTMLDVASGKATGKVFPMTKRAFKLAWVRIRARANIKYDVRKERLNFHDLRREAGCRFDEAELSSPQRSMMLGHSEHNAADAYVNSPALKRIQDKLDRHAFNGLTMDEYIKKKEGIEQDNIVLLKRK